MLDTNDDLQKLINLIRSFAAIPQRKQISSDSLLEEDLGISGDDGCELLEEIEKRFKIKFSSNSYTLREAFGLSPQEYLFHSECFFSIGGEPVRPINVGDILIAIQWVREHA